MPRYDRIDAGFPPGVSRALIRAEVRGVLHVKSSLIEASNARAMVLVSRRHPTGDAGDTIEAEPPFGTGLYGQCRDRPREFGNGV